MATNLENTNQIGECASNSTVGGLSLKSKNLLRQAQGAGSQFSLQQQQMLHQQLQSHIDLLALKDKEKKRGETKKLKKRLLEVAEMNDSLAKAISNKNNEIASLKNSVQSLNDVLNSVPIDELRSNSSIATTKILDLSKKNRLLRAELETTKNRLSKKEMEMQKLEREFKQMSERYNREHETVRKGDKPTLIDEMQNKINQLQQRLFDSRNKHIELQNQLKLAQKCLQQEVGENFNLNTMSNAVQTNWRGRAQQILHLQQKVNELKERLEAYENNASGSERLNSYNCVSAPTSVVIDTSAMIAMAAQNQNHAGSVLYSHAELQSYSSSTSVMDRYATGVRKTEILHRAKVENLEKEISELKLTIEDLRGKMLALKVRNKTLNDEVNKYKSKANSLEEQTGYNGMNLAELTEKLSIQKYQYECRLDELKQQMQEMSSERERIEAREQETLKKLKSTESELEMRNSYIMELTDVIKRLEEDLKSICGGYLFSCRQLKKEEFLAILDALESEKNGLLEHNKVLTERLRNERVRNEGLAETIAKQKIRISRSEARIRELEKEIDMQNERKKRTQRITEYANSISSNTATSGISTFVFENSSPSPLACGDNATDDKDNTTKEIAELKNQLEFITEKKAMLEEKIAYLNQEKENDAKLFEDIVNNSKNIILEVILSHSHLSEKQTDSQFEDSESQI